MSPGDGQGDALELFDVSYPNLRKVSYSEWYGRMELISVVETSDGFLMGHALIGEGDGQYMQSVFLGTVADFKASAPAEVGEGPDR